MLVVAQGSKNIGGSKSDSGFTILVSELQSIKHDN